MTSALGIVVVPVAAALVALLTPIFTKRIGPQSGQSYW